MGANPFAGLKDAKIHEQGNFIQPGLYDLEISKCLLKQTRKSGLAFIAEFKVLRSTDEAKHPVGSKVTWLQKMGDADVAFGSLKLFAYAVLGLDPVKDREQIMKEVDPKIEGFLQGACETNDLAGTKVRVQVTMKKTLKGNDFSKHDFQPYPG